MNKKLIDRYYAAWNTLSTDSPASFYAKEANIAFFDVAPLKYNGWAEYKRGVQKSIFDQISAGKLTPNDDLKITRHGCRLDDFVNDQPLSAAFFGITIHAVTG